MDSRVDDIHASRRRVLRVLLALAVIAAVAFAVLAWRNSGADVVVTPDQPQSSNSVMSSAAPVVSDETEIDLQAMIVGRRWFVVSVDGAPPIVPAWFELQGDGRGGGRWTASDGCITQTHDGWILDGSDLVADTVNGSSGTVVPMECALEFDGVTPWRSPLRLELRSPDMLVARNAVHGEIVLSPTEQTPEVEAEN